MLHSASQVRDGCVLLAPVVSPTWMTRRIEASMQRTPRPKSAATLSFRDRGICRLRMRDRGRNMTGRCLFNGGDLMPCLLVVGLLLAMSLVRSTAKASQKLIKLPRMSRGVLPQAPEVNQELSVGQAVMWRTIERMSVMRNISLRVTSAS